MLSQLKSLTKINPPVCVSKYLLATTVVLNIKRAWYSQCTDTASKLFRQLNSTDLLKVSTYVGSHCLGWVTKVWKQGQNSPETPELASCPGKRAWGPVAKSQRENTGWIRGSLMEEEGTTHPAVERGRPWCGRRKGSRQHAHSVCLCTPRGCPTVSKGEQETRWQLRLHAWKITSTTFRVTSWQSPSSCNLCFVVGGFFCFLY